jgi:hypothetical protein
MKKYFFLLLVIVFFLNTASHDYFCHEELEGLCSPLHFGSIITEADQAVQIPMRPPLLSVLDWASAETVIPGFITDIYHPPDFASLP